MPFKTIEPGKPVRIAFLGCGFAAKLHSKTLGKMPGVERYYASRSADKAAAFCKKHKGKGHFDSYEAAIDSPDIDVVMILTPPMNHLKLALAAIQAGKHVIVEKPPFLHSSDFDTVKEEQRKHRVQVMVAENYFYKPSLARLRELLGSGLIGEVKFIYLNATKLQKTNNWRDDELVSGGGALYEGGIHWISFLSNMGFLIHTVQGFQPGERTGMDRSIQVVAKFTEGAVGTLLYSWEVNALLKGVRISKAFGTRGSITFESNGLFIFVRGKKWKLIFPGLRDLAGYRAMFTNFIKALREGHEPAFNQALAKSDLQLIEIIQEDMADDL